MLRTTDRDKYLKPGIGVRLLLLLALVWPAIGLREAEAQSSPSAEYQVKAALLLNFAEFIEWPAAAFSKPDAPITVGVLGSDPFGVVLDQTFQDESVQGRKIVIKRSQQIEELKSCQLLFISKSEKEHLGEIVGSLSNTSVVTVGETDGFAEHGGIINFYIDNKKVRFEINADAAQHNGLKISSQLLRRAKIVGSEPGKSRE
jgi:hypothetical protein